jgi:CRP/FNR family transcriptional regulator, cyclic AMP receptor protein
MDCRDCLNSKCFIQKYCLPGWLEYIQNNKTRKYFSAAKSLFSEGDLVKGSHVICEGKVKVLLNHGKGNEHIIRIAGQGQIIGYRGFSEKMVSKLLPKP